MYLIQRKKKDKNKDLWDFKDELIYWRKANEVHRFFCDKGKEIEKEISYKLKKEDLEELLDICNTILDSALIIPGKVKNGSKYNPETQKLEPIIENGLIIANKELCEELLPTQEGFFFGSTEYDEYYLEDIKYTKEKLEEILKQINEKENNIYYLASW